MATLNKNRDWIDVSAKLLPGIGAILAGILIPLVIHISSEENRKSQLYVEIVSKREVADSELRAKMFDTLIKFFYGNVSQLKSNNEKLTSLHLLALNFHESFDLKPLFEGIKSQLSPAEVTKLRDIVAEIAGKQEAMLSQVKEGRVFEETVPSGGSILLPPEEQPAYMGHRLGIEVEEIGQDGDFARLRVVDMPDENRNIAENAVLKFKLSYCDLPFIDNTKLFDHARFAITLKRVVTDEEKRKAVNLKVIFFPETYMSSRDRPFLDEILNKLKENKEKI